MDLLIHSDFFLEYINCLLKPNKDAYDNMVISIISNPKNSVLFNSRLQDLISAQIPKNHPLRSYYELFISQMINNRVILIQSGDADDIFGEINLQYSSLKLHTSKSGTYAKISFNEYEENNGLKFASIRQSVKPNFHWINCSLAANCPDSITLRYSDFNNQQEITNALQTVYEIANVTTFVNVFDRHRNLDHPLFDWFIGTCRVEYLTMRTPRPILQTLYNELHAKFNRVQVYTANNNDDLHERRILFIGLVIEFDDDFFNIVPNRPTWKIDITCCDVLSKVFIDKKNNLFSRQIF